LLVPDWATSNVWFTLAWIGFNILNPVNTGLTLDLLLIFWWRFDLFFFDESFGWFEIFRKNSKFTRFSNDLFFKNNNWSRWLDGPSF
jgi:hypothetical protein